MKQAKRAATGWFGRLLSLFVAITLAFSPATTLAKPPKKKAKGVNAEVAKVCRRAEKLLNKLEYERARELLESSVRKKKYRAARASNRSRLWVLLGRARAELGDMVGTDAAFLEAVKWNRRVRLPKSTSPKILEALERARANAPVESEPVEVPKKVAATEPKPKKVKKAKKTKTVKRTKKPKQTKTTAKTRKKRRKRPPGIRPHEPWIRHRIIGEIKPGNTVTLLVEHGNLGKWARFEAKLRRTQSGSFRSRDLTRTGTVAKTKIRIDRPRIELYVNAVEGMRVRAMAGSQLEPIVLTTAPKPPTLSEAWSQPEPPLTEPQDTGSSTVASAKTSTTSALPPPPPPPPPVVEEGGLSGTEIGLIVAGSITLVAGATIIAILFATGDASCEAPEGFGCAEVQVVPLMSF